MTEVQREIVHRFRVQPGLNVAIEDSLNILFEVTQPDGSEILRYDVISNIDYLKDMLDLARVWVAAAEDDANSKRMAELWEKTAPRRHPRSGNPA
jgi:hypothetical protein